MISGALRSALQERTPGTLEGETWSPELWRYLRDLHRFEAEDLTWWSKSGTGIPAYPDKRRWSLTAGHITLATHRTFDLLQARCAWAIVPAMMALGQIDDPAHEAWAALEVKIAWLAHEASHADLEQAASSLRHHLAEKGTESNAFKSAYWAVVPRPDQSFRATTHARALMSTGDMSMPAEMTPAEARQWAERTKREAKTRGAEIKSRFDDLFTAYVLHCLERGIHSKART